MMKITLKFCFFEEAKKDIEDSLKDFSYSEIVIPKIEELIKSDKSTYSIILLSVIVLYNFKYNGAKSEDKTENIEMKFIGNVQYKQIVKFC